MSMERSAMPKGHLHFAIAAYQFFLEQDQQLSCSHAQAILSNFNTVTRCTRAEPGVNACDVPLYSMRKRASQPELHEQKRKVAKTG